MQLAGTLGGSPQLRLTGALPRQFVGVVLAEQLAIGTLDLFRRAGLRYAEEREGFCIVIVPAHRRTSFSHTFELGRQLFHSLSSKPHPAPPQADAFAIGHRHRTTRTGHGPATAQPAFGPGCISPQRQQAQTPATFVVLATTKRGDRQRLLRLIQPQTLHLATRQTNMLGQYAPITLGHSPQQHEQQLITMRQHLPAQSSHEGRPGVELQPAIQQIAKQTTQQDTRNTGQRQSGGRPQQGGRPAHQAGTASSCSTSARRSWVPTSTQRPWKCSPLTRPSAMAARSSGASLKAPALQPANSCGCSSAMPL